MFQFAEFLRPYILCCIFIQWCLRRFDLLFSDELDMPRLRIRPLAMHSPLVLQEVITPYKAVPALAFAVRDVTWKELRFRRREVCFHMAFQICFSTKCLPIFTAVHSAEVLSLGVI